MFYFDEIAGKKVVKSDLLKEVEHFFTTREFCLFSKTEDMFENRKILKEYLGENPATSQPVHGVHIAKVQPDLRFYKETDGLLVEKGAAYMNFGDCTPLILYCHKAVMISHAGWRGTVQEMAKVSVRKMTEMYGILPEEIKVVIGPAICSDCYEVGEEVYYDLLATVKEKGQGFVQKEGKYFVDLKQINKQQLLECGVEKIDVCPYCTACGEKLFFSYRCENHTGYRHSAVVKI